MDKLRATSPLLVKPSEGLIPYYEPDRTERALADIVRHVPDIKLLCNRLIGEGNTTVSAIHVLLDSLLMEHQIVLTIAATFRRPRSVVGLRRLAAAALRRQGSYYLECFTRLEREDIDASRSLVYESYKNTMRRVDAILEQLEEAGLIRRLEGGTYWMHSAARDYIYWTAMKREPQGMANLHELLAYYNYELVYASSRDIAALFEFGFHQVSAIRESAPDRQLSRCKTLLSCLVREHSHLSARAHSGTLLEWIRALREVELKRLLNSQRDVNLKSKQTNVKLQRILQRLLAFLCDFEAGILRNGTRLPRVPGNPPRTNRASAEGARQSVGIAAARLDRSEAVGKEI